MLPSEKLIQALNRFGVHLADAVLIASHFKEEKVPKGFYIKEGDITNKIGFLAEGTMQYFQEADGNEISTHIAKEGEFVVSLASYIQGNPCKENIRAMTDSVILTLTRNKQLALCETIPVFKDFFISLLEYTILCIDDSKNSLLVLSAEERYLKLLKEEPKLMQEVPLYLVAALLGVTPRHLTRIRGTIM